MALPSACDSFQESCSAAFLHTRFRNTACAGRCAIAPAHPQGPVPRTFLLCRLFPAGFHQQGGLCCVPWQPSASHVAQPGSPGGITQTPPGPLSVAGLLFPRSTGLSGQASSRITSSALGEEAGQIHRASQSWLQFIMNADERGPSPDSFILRRRGI